MDTTNYIYSIVPCNMGIKKYGHVQEQTCQWSPDECVRAADWLQYLFSQYQAINLRARSRLIAWYCENKYCFPNLYWANWAIPWWSDRPYTATSMFIVHNTRELAKYQIRAIYLCTWKHPLSSLSALGEHFFWKWKYTFLKAVEYHFPVFIRKLHWTVINIFLADIFWSEL